MNETPEDIDVLLTAADVAFRSCDFQKAHLLLGEAAEQAPNSTRRLQLLGAVLHAMDRREEAIACFRKLIRVNPAFQDAYTDIAILFWETNRRREALAYLERAIRRWPSFAKAAELRDHFRAALDPDEAQPGRTLQAEERVPDRDASEQLRLATAQLHEGNFAASDFICRDILADDPGNVAAMTVLGTVADRIGLRTKAIEHFQAVLALDPGDRLAQENLRRLENLPAPVVQEHAIEGRRYLLIKAWGCGFWSDVGHVMGSLLLADITGRIPVTHWGPYSLFSDGSGGDAFRSYFEPMSPFTLDALLALDGADFFPAKWSAANLGRDEQSKWHGPGSRMAAIEYLCRPETVAVTDFYIGMIDLLPWIPKTHRLFGKTLDEVYRDLAARYLRPKAEILAAVDAFYDQHLSGAPAIAVHVRGTDKRDEMPDVAKFNRRYFDLLDRCDPNARIFLLTDDVRWSEAFRARYDGRVVQTDCLRAAGATGIHLLPAADQRRLGVEVMIDTYLAMRCARFIGNGRSNVSAFVAALKSWGNGECTLLAPSLLHERNLYIHTEPR